MSADEFSVPCPARTCRAEIGEVCCTSTGQVRAEPHGLRWLATLPGPLVRCPDGPCEACHWTALVQDPRFAAVLEMLSQIEPEVPVRITVETWRRAPNGGSGWEHRAHWNIVPGVEGSGGD